MTGLWCWNDDSFVHLGEKPLHRRMHIADIPRSQLHGCLLLHPPVCLRKRGTMFSPVRGSNGGSLSIFLHTSLSQISSDIAYIIVCSYSWTSIWADHSMISKKNTEPDAVAWQILQLPSIHIASWNYCLLRVKPCSCSGKAVSHVDTPFSVPSSIALCSVAEIYPFTCSALAALVWYFSRCRADLTDCSKQQSKRTDHLHSRCKRRAIEKRPNTAAKIAALTPLTLSVILHYRP